MTLATVVSDNKKGLLKDVNRKRRSKNIGLTVDADGHLTSEDEEKVEATNAFFFFLPQFLIVTTLY